MTALGAYKLDTGTFPTTEQGLQALRVQAGRTCPSGTGPYLPQDIPKDPWGHPYLYKYPGEHGDEPDIMSLRRRWRSRAARDQCRHRQLEKPVKRRCTAGITLIEMMIVLALVGMVTAIAFPSVTSGIGFRSSLLGFRLDRQLP